MFSDMCSIKIMSSAAVKQKASPRCFAVQGSLTFAGHLMEGGKIACGCLECEGAPVSLSEFEEHSGSWERHLSESVYLTNHSTSLKVLHQLDSALSSCRQ